VIGNDAGKKASAVKSRYVNELGPRRTIKTCARIDIKHVSE
jgi:hypothetical protein